MHESISDEIDRLRKENTELRGATMPLIHQAEERGDEKTAALLKLAKAREALREYAPYCDCGDPKEHPHDRECLGEIARKALKEIGK